jgi:hypothetical protein
LVLQLPDEWHGNPVEIEECGVKRRIDKAEPEAMLSLWISPNTTAEFAVSKA